MFPEVAKDLTLGEAAAAIGVSADTLRRWDRAGKLKTFRDDRNRRMVTADEVRRLTRRPQRHETGRKLSARNRMTGGMILIDEATNTTVGTVMITEAH